MGRRARANGIANATLRAARATKRRRDEEAAAIAQRVYNAAVELKGDGAPEPLPLAIFAPLVVAAETVAPASLKLAHEPVTEEAAREVAAYLVAGFREMAVMFDVQHFEAWRRASSDAGLSESANDG